MIEIIELEIIWETIALTCENNIDSNSQQSGM